MLLKPSHLLHHHLLRCPGDLCQKVHEVFLVHPAAVVGKGIETALHTERQQDAALGVVGEGGVLRGQTLPQALFDAVGKDALTGIGKEDVHRRFVLTKARNSSRVSASVRTGCSSTAETLARMSAMSLSSNRLDSA